jgi:hypothetical protein
MRGGLKLEKKVNRHMRAPPDYFLIYILHANTRKQHDHTRNSTKIWMSLRTKSNQQQIQQNFPFFSDPS